ncbi:MAG: hypothetical protein ACI9JN_001721 [Bacteroidia bacterium]|jgi:hypothetical protein
MGYRSESYFQYLKVHSSGLIQFLKKQIIYSLIITAVLIFVGISMESLFVTSFLTVIIFAFQLIGNCIIMYAFPMTLYYKVYKHSGRLYNVIKTRIVYETFNVIVTTEFSELSLDDSLNRNSQPIADKVDYEFDYCDVFETKRSLFLFPIRNSKGDAKFFKLTYLRPIRFMFDKTELIPDSQFVHPITDFVKTFDNQDVVFSFKDRRLQNEVSIRLVEYHTDLLKI